MPRQICLICLLFITALLPAAADPAPPALDLMPLKKALAPLYSDGAIKSHTVIRIDGSDQGKPFTLREDLQITARHPGQFHAEITSLDAQSGPKKRMSVVSNGANVWTYRPGLRQYSVMSVPAFQAAASDVPTLGLIVGGFYLGAGRPMVQAFRSITPGNSAEVLAALNTLEITLSRHAQSVANQDDYVYQMVLAKQNLTYEFYVNSQTNMLNRVELTGTQNSLQITYREDITQIAPQSAVTKSTFTFLPPPGTSKAASVSLDHF